MTVFVTAKPNSKKTEVISSGANKYIVRVTQPPVDNKANKAIIEALSDFLGVSKSRISLVRGIKGKVKVFEII